MAEPSWRNPRPAPQVSEMRQRVAARDYVQAFFRSWWPALLWAGLIFFLSTDVFSAEHTGSIFYGLLHWAIPSLTLEQFEPIHYLIRKTAHFTEYFIFCGLLFQQIGRAHV